MTAAAVERVARFTAWPGFEVPSFDGVAGGLIAGPPADELLDAVYYDAKDLRLVRAGVTVRHRSGRTGAVWTVTFSRPRDHGALARREVDLVLPPGPPPPEVVALVRAFLRTAELVPVAHLQTRRRRVEVLAGDHVLAEVDDDEVSVLDGEHVAARFREVEVEISPDAPAEVLDGLVGRLREAGAGAPDPTPRLVRALGPRALQPADVVPVDVDPDATVAELVQQAFAASALRIIENDVVVRLDDDPEGVHQARVGARRLRSDLRTFRPLLDPDRIGSIGDEMQWLGHRLGEVRDADVLLARLHEDAGGLARDVDRAAAQALLEKLAVQRAESRERAVEALSSDRYAALVEHVVDLAHDPPVSGAASKRAAAVLPGLVAKPFRSLAKAVDRLPDQPGDDDLHAVRKRAKRARYAARAAAPVCGRDAARLARSLEHLQDVLGERQDAVVAETWLRTAAAEAPPEQAMAAGLLISRRRADIGRLDRAWRQAWKAASAKKVTRWLS